MIENIPDDLLHALLDNPCECLILVDADGILRFFSSSNDGVIAMGVVKLLSFYEKGSPNGYPRLSPGSTKRRFTWISTRSW
jgi:hypothetical protein